MNLRKDINTQRGSLDENVGRLMSAAYRPPRPNPVFKDWLGAQLERQRTGLPVEHADEEVRSCLDDNLTRVLVAATADVELRPDARRTFRHALREEIESRKRHGHLPYWAPRLVAAGASAVVLAGFLLFPLLWSHVQPHADVTVANNQAEVLQVRPLFFNLGTRVETHMLVEGESIALYAGDTIQTGSGSSSVLSLFGSGEVTLYPESKLTLLQLTEAQDGQPETARVRLDAGLVKTDVTDVMLAVDTPAASASVEGTQFKVEVVADSHTHVATNEGTVRVDMGGQSVRVAAGQQVDAIVGQPLQVLEQGPPFLIIDGPAIPEVKGTSLTLAGRTDVDATVSVDGRQVPVDIEGRFAAQLTLEAGANEIVVTATSPIGRSVTVELVLVYEGD